MENKTKPEDPRLTEIKAKFTGKITTLIVPLDQDEDEETVDRKTATFYIRNIDKTTRNMMGTLASKNKSEAAVIAGLKAMRLGGDEVAIIENNDYALISLEEALIQHMQVAKTILKKN